MGSRWGSRDRGGEETGVIGRGSRVGQGWSGLAGHGGGEGAGSGWGGPSSVPGARECQAASSGNWPASPRLASPLLGLA